MFANWNLLAGLWLPATLLLFTGVNARVWSDDNQPAQSSTDGLDRGETVRVAAVQSKRRLVDWRLTDPAEVLAIVDVHLDELEAIIHRAGDRRCDVLAFPEDTLGLLNWFGPFGSVGGRDFQAERSQDS